MDDDVARIARTALARNEAGKKNARKGVQARGRTPGEIGSLKVVRASCST